MLAAVLERHEILNYVIIPLLIVIARVIDVTLGTLRIIFVSKGYKRLAPVLGFFEVLIWLLAIGQIMQNLTNFVNYIAYAIGFGLGNYIGIYVESKLSMGVVMLRIVTKKDATDLIGYLKKSGYGATVVDAEGEFGSVNIVFTVIKRKAVSGIIKIIKQFNPNAFYTLEDIRFVSQTLTVNGKENGNGWSYNRLFKFQRRGK